MRESHSVENMDRFSRSENFSPLPCITPTATRSTAEKVQATHPRKIKMDTLRFLQTGTPKNFR
jgi:hypothetical protein